MIGTTVSHYRIVEKLGGGGMGVVYKAEDARLKRPVALKFLPPQLTQDEEAKQRFIHEAQAASALQHNNICVVYDIDETAEGQLFISMEYLPGETLKKKIERGPIPVDQAIDIAVQIGRGLTKAHESGILHRDIKPANIMITTDGEAKIVDFGLAKLAGQSNLTRAGSTLGTLAYMSPEQLRGLTVDERTDIWALGAVLYEMVSGRQPFNGEYDPAILYAILDTEPEPIARDRSDIPPMLVTVLARALAKAPASRYQHIHEMIRDLQSITVGASPSQPLRPGGTAPRRIPWYMYAGGAAVLCGIVVAVFLLAGRPSGYTPIRAIAVLPFRNTSPRLDDTVFAEGMTTALSTELSRIRALVVRSSRSALRFKNSDMPVAEIARELNVDALIDGSTQLSGTTARVSVSLINVHPEQQIWGESYRKHIEDINTLQSSIAQAIVQKLQVVLTPDEAAQLARRESVNAEAYQACMYGRFYWNRYTPESFQKSLVFFRMAATKDPSYAPAYAGIADVYATLWYNGNVPFDSVEPHWRPAAQKAVDLDPSMAEGHVSLAATRLVYDWDWAGAEKGLRHALSLNPSYATGHNWYALLLSALGRHDSALVEIRRAQTLDPLSVAIAASAGWIHIYAFRYDEAIPQLRTALELDTNCAPAHSGLGEIFELQGHNEKALEEYLRVARVTGGSFATLGGGTEDAVSRLRSAYLASGWNGYWNEQLSQLDKLARHRFVSAYHIACVCARLRKNSDAFRWLQKAYQERSTNLLYANVDPNLSNLKGDPRYAALMRLIGLAPSP